MKIKTFTLKQSMCNLAGRSNYSFISLLLIFFLCSSSFAETAPFDPKTLEWKEFALEAQRMRRRDYLDGLSYIISGSVALAGGIWGANITDDSVEQGIYTVFQTIGVASVGYGAYQWRVGGEERSLYDTLRIIHGLSDKEKTVVLRAYYFQKRKKERQERVIKAVTHGLLAALNLYNGSQQKQDSIRNGLYFIGGVNLLAALSFTFEF